MNIVAGTTPVAFLGSLTPGSILVLGVGIVVVLALLRFAFKTMKKVVGVAIVAVLVVVVGGGFLSGAFG